MRALSIAVALGALAAVGTQACLGGLWPVLAAMILALLPCKLEAPARAVAIWAAALTAAAAVAFLWQIAMAMAVLALGGLMALSPALWPSEPGWVGRVPPLPTLVAGGITPVALVSWLLAAQPDLSDIVALVSGLPLPVLLVAAVGFVFVNAALEELLWRGLLQSHLTALLGPALAIALQAASFGLQHAHGVPRGAAGVLLAGGWAVLLGLLRHHARGLLAPFLAHVVADATIALIVLWTVLR